MVEGGSPAVQDCKTLQSGSEVSLYCQLCTLRDKKLNQRFVVRIIAFVVSWTWFCGFIPFLHLILLAFNFHDFLQSLDTGVSCVEWLLFSFGHQGIIASFAKIFFTIMALIRHVYPRLFSILSHSQP